MKSTSRTIYILICITIISACHVFIWDTKPTLALTGADVAVYTDLHTNDSGVWSDGLTAIYAMLTSFNVSYEEIDYIDLNEAPEDFNSLYKIIFFPGGMAYHYNNLICETGKSRIRDFVFNGGGYFGICAGSFFAMDQIIWDDAVGGGNPVQYDDDTGYQNACGGPSGYSLDLFPGIGTGPINSIASFYDPYEGWAMATLNFQANTVIPAFRGSNGLKNLPFSEDIMYYGGPYFTIDTQNPSYANISNYEVLATYAYNGEPAIIAFSYGSGRVVLFGPHPEIEEDSPRDNQNLTDYPLSPRKLSLYDNGSDWELVSHTFSWLFGKPIEIAFVMTPPRVKKVMAGRRLGPFSIVATNHTTGLTTHQIQTCLYTPWGAKIQLPAITCELEAGATRHIQAFLPIPEIASAGPHELHATVTDANGTIVDQDYFLFIVRPQQLASANQGKRTWELHIE